jgi:hypothetical protein
VLDVAQVENLMPVESRQPMPELSSEKRVDLSLEVEIGFTEEEARLESARCLNCGLICYIRSKYH